MITLKSIKYLSSLAFLGVVLVSCFQSDYTKLVNAELGKGIRQDSLLLGMKFGDSRFEFQGKCFDLNQSQLLTAGPNGYAQYLFADSIVHDKPTDLKLLLSPTFDKSDIITEIKLELSYQGWAPWNRKYQSDSLEVKVKELLMHWYKGNEFVLANIGDRKVPVKLDGNRRILVYIIDKQTVGVKLQDILNPMFSHSGKKVEE